VDVEVEGLGFLVFLTVGEAVVVVVVVDVVGGSVVVCGVEVVVVVLGVQDGDGVADRSRSQGGRGFGVVAGVGVCPGTQV
jgi:hypothetical protein